MIAPKSGVRRGFTMIEIMVVLAVGAILAVIVTPRWLEYRSRMIVSESANQFCAAVREARDRALMNQCYVLVDVKHTGGTVTVTNLTSGTPESGTEKVFRLDESVVVGTSDMQFCVGRGGILCNTEGVVPPSLPRAQANVGGSNITVYYVDFANNTDASISDRVYMTGDCRLSIGAGSVGSVSSGS